MKLNKRAVALLVSLVMLLTAAVGATVAFIIDRSQDVENTFTPSRVACRVVEKTAPAGASKAYTVKNIGDTAAYIRVAVLVNWKNGDGQLYAQAPEFTVTPGDGWHLGADGYYYFTKSVAVDAEISEVLLISINSAAPAGYEQLSVEVVASAIQATSEAVSDWSSGVATVGVDGTLTVTTQ